MSKLIVRTVSAYNEMIRTVLDEVLEESGEGRSVEGILGEVQKRFQEHVQVSSRHRTPNHGDIIVEEIMPEHIEIH